LRAGIFRRSVFVSARTISGTIRSLTEARAQAMVAVSGEVKG